MMECYQKCIDIGKRCTSLGSTGTCTDCGQICGSNFFNPAGSNCRCSTTQNEKTDRGESHERHEYHGTTAAGKPKSVEKQKEKQSFWQWLLSLFGFGGGRDKSEEEKAADKYDIGKPQSIKSHRPAETFSPEAILAEVKEICGEIKKLKPDLAIKEEQPSPPTATRKESITQTNQSPETKKTTKSKKKSPPRSAGREKYLGKPLESSPPRSKSRSGSVSPQQKDKSPKRTNKSPVRRESAADTEEPVVASGYQPQSNEKSSVVQKSRPRTSPIFSSQRYLKPYSSELCVKDSACLECCECSSKAPSTLQGGSGTKPCNKKQGCPENTSTMHSQSCLCSICCGKPCLLPCKPICYCCPCNTPCCKPLFASCSFCCCRSDLQNNMKKQRTCAQASCSPRSRGCKNKRRRCTSCPTSPTCSSRRSNSGPPICPPCPPSLPRSCSPPCKFLPRGPPCCCPLASECSRARNACRSPCPPTRPCKPPCSMCLPMRSGSPSCCPRPCSGCPITCMKPCCLPCLSNCPPACPQRCSSPSSGSQFSFKSSGAMMSYSKSKDNDSLCKQLMAKYNITAPEPRAFCPLPRNVCTPRNVCSPCEVARIPQPTRYSSHRAIGCPPCRSSCFNNNKPLSFIKTTDYDTFPYSLNVPSPYKTRVKDPVIFNTSPSHSRPRMEFRIPKRTPVHCIKQTGPRSPCKEFMTTYNFVKEPRRHDVSEIEQQSLIDEKPLESPRKSGQKAKSKKLGPSEVTTAGSAEQIMLREIGENLSENKAVFSTSLDSHESSSLLSWRMARNKSQKGKTRSRSSDTVKKPHVVHKENMLPLKSGRSADWNPYSRRYSQSSKNCFPSFLNLLPTNQLSRQPTALTSEFDQLERVCAKTSVGEFSTCKRNVYNAKLSSHVTIDNQPFGQKQPGSTFYCGAVHKVNNYNISKTAQDPREKSSFPSTHAQCSMSDTPSIFHLRNYDDVRSKELNIEVDDVPPPEESGIKETNSCALLPNVESISNLVEKYDRVEVSAIGVMAQSKCNIFDYISAESSSAITPSLKEDPSLSMVVELTSEEKAVEETTDIVPNQKSIDSPDLSDLINDNEEESEEMNKNHESSKIGKAHGDADRPCRPVKSIPKTKDGVRISQSIGDNVHVPIKDLKLETVAENVGLSHCCCVYLKGESSVDPAEYGTIGESAVDPLGSKYQCKAEGNSPKALINQTNHSNNLESGDPSEAKIDPVEPTSIGESENGGSEAITVTSKVVEEMLKAEETNCKSLPKSDLDELLGSSGVRWTRVTPSTEADLKLLRLGKASYSRSANVGPLTNRQPGSPRASSSSQTNTLADPKPKSVLDLLRPGEIADKGGSTAISDACSCDSSASQISEFGTPV